MITRSKEVNIYINLHFVIFNPVDQMCAQTTWFPRVDVDLQWFGTSPCLAHGVEMRFCDCCVPSEGICLCFISSQDSRRERSNNFQAFVKMALETLLGSCRRKHGGPRGKQGWVHHASTTPWARSLGCCVVFQYSICSPLTEAESGPELRLSPSVFQPLFPPPDFPTFFRPLPHAVCSGLLDAQKQAPG